LNRFRLSSLNIAVAITLNVVSVPADANPNGTTPTATSATPVGAAPVREAQKVPSAQGLPNDHVSGSAGASKYGTAPKYDAQKAPSHPTLKRADLVVESQGYELGWRVKNTGNDGAPASKTRVTCTVWVAKTGSDAPCVEGTHYITGPGTPPPPGTTKSGNVWTVPTPTLLSTAGVFAFSINIKTTPEQRVAGLKFMACADANAAIIESNESNNCLGSNYTWPN
jgi:hypothetical protein